MPGVDLVDDAVIVHVCHKDRTLDNTLEVHAGGFQNGSEILEDLFRLSLDRFGNEVGSLGVQSNLTGAVQSVVDEYSLAVRTDSSRGTGSANAAAR